MPEEWLPPRAPAHPPDSSLPRASGVMPRPPTEQERERVQPSHRGAVILGATSVLVTLLSAGTGFAFGAILGGGALWLGRRVGHRPAVVLGYVALGLAVVAAMTWLVLAGQGITPQDLQDTLRDELDRQRS